MMETKEYDRIRELNYVVLRHLGEVLGEAEMKVLTQKMNQRHLLPQRVDFRAQERRLDIDDLNKRYGWIPRNYLSSLMNMMVNGKSNMLQPHQPQNSSLLARGTLAVVPSMVPPHPSTKYRTLQRNISPVHAILSRERGGFFNRRSKTAINMQGRLRKLKVTCGHLAPIYCVVISYSSKRAYTGADDGLIKVWSILDGSLIRTLRGHKSEITDLQISPQDTLIASSSTDCSVRVWSATDWSEIAHLKGHTEEVLRVRFSPCGKTLLTASLDGFARLYLVSNFNDSTGFALMKRGGTGRQKVECSAIDVHPSGTEFVVGTNDNCAHVFSMKQNAVCFDPPQELKFSQTDWKTKSVLSEQNLDRFMTTTDAEYRRFRGYRVESEVNYARRNLLSILDGHFHEVSCIAYSHGGHRILTGSQDGRVRMWIRPDAQTQIKMGRRYVCYGVLTTRDEATIQDVGWSLDDRYVVTSDNSSQVKIWDSFTSVELRSLTLHSGDPPLIRFHPHDRRVLLTAGGDGKIILWDLITGRMIRRWETRLKLLDAAYSPDGLFLTFTSNSGQILIFGSGSREYYFQAPDEQFFERDYKRLEHSNMDVLDAEEKIPPHFLPNGNLIDRGRNVYVDQPKTMEARLELAPIPSLKSHPDATLEEREEDIANHQANLWKRSVELDGKWAEYLSALRVEQKRAHDSDSEGDETREPTYGNLVPPHQRFTLSQLRYRVHLTNPQTPAPAAASEPQAEDTRVRMIVAPTAASQAPVPHLLPVSANPAQPQSFPGVSGAASAISSGVGLRTRGRGRSMGEVHSSSNQRERRVPVDMSEEDEDYSDSAVSSEDDDDENYEEPTPRRRRKPRARVVAAFSSPSSHQSSQNYRRSGRRTGTRFKEARRVRKVPTRFEEEYQTNFQGDYDQDNSRDSRNERYKKREMKKQKEEEDRPRKRQRHNDLSDAPPSLEKEDYEWIQKSEYDDKYNSFVPQRGDQLVYFHQGHRQYLNELAKYGVHVTHLNDPLEDIEYPAPVIHGSVKDVEYCREEGDVSVPRVYCKLTLHLTSSVSRVRTRRQKVEEFEEIIIDVYKIDFPDFLVLQPRYDHSMAQSWRAGERIRVWYKDMKRYYFGEIVRLSLSDKMYPGSPWEQFVVRWDPDDGNSTEEKSKDIAEEKVFKEDEKMDSAIKSTKQEMIVEGVEEAEGSENVLVPSQPWVRRSRRKRTQKREEVGDDAERKIPKEEEKQEKVPKEEMIVEGPERTEGSENWVRRSRRKRNQKKVNLDDDSEEKMLEEETIVEDSERGEQSENWVRRSRRKRNQKTETNIKSPNIPPRRSTRSRSTRSNSTLTHIPHTASEPVTTATTPPLRSTRSKKAETSPQASETDEDSDSEGGGALIVRIPKRDGAYGVPVVYGLGMDEKEEISTPCTPRRSLRSRKSSLKNRTSTETETPDVREPETPDAKEPETPDVKEPEAPDVKESEIPDVKEPETPDVKEPAAIEEEKAKVTDEKEEVDGSKSTSEAVKQTLDRLSAWELTPLEEDKHLVFRPMTLDPAIKESALKIVDSLMDTKEFEPFRFPVDLEHFPHYTGLVNVPIDLSLIRARIENDYYRQIDALTFDIKHIQANCVRFNKPDSFVVKAVENMVKKYEEARDDLRGANVG